MEDKKERRIIIGPLTLLLKSRRVIIGLSGLIVSGLVMIFPQLELVQSELLMIVTSTSLVLIAGLSHEDAAIAGRNQNLKEAKEYALELVEETIEVFEESRNGT